MTSKSDAIEGGFKGKKWFSASDAAKYLGVSEPTIFRWMREGLLSYYKIGGATRFSQDGLDAVFQKNTGQLEAEAAQGKCVSCGHHRLIEGKFRGTGQMYFRPDKTKFWVFEEAMVSTKGKVCASCGYIHIFADTSKLTRLIPEESETLEEEEK